MNINITENLAVIGHSDGWVLETSDVRGRKKIVRIQSRFGWKDRFSSVEECMNEAINYLIRISDKTTINEARTEAVRLVNVAFLGDEMKGKTEKSQEIKNETYDRTTTI